MRSVRLRGHISSTLTTRTSVPKRLFGSSLGLARVKRMERPSGDQDSTVSGPCVMRSTRLPSAGAVKIPVSLPDTWSTTLNAIVAPCGDQDGALRLPSRPREAPGQARQPPPRWLSDAVSCVLPLSLAASLRRFAFRPAEEPARGSTAAVAFVRRGIRVLARSVLRREDLYRGVRHQAREGDHADDVEGEQEESEDRIQSRRRIAPCPTTYSRALRRRPPRCLARA